MNVNDFDRQARQAEQQVVGEAKETIIAAALDLYQTVSRDTNNSRGGLTGSPVASGRFASSTRVSINSIDSSVAKADPNYRYPLGKGPRPLPPRTIPNQPVSRVAALLRTFKLGDTIWVSNSLPYSRRIEVGRHSWQTPDGVFSVAVRAVLKRFADVKIRVENV